MLCRHLFIMNFIDQLLSGQTSMAAYSFITAKGGKLTCQPHPDHKPSLILIKK